MKKTISIILIVLAIILIHTNVFADMDAPSVDPYTAYINNVNGAPYYGYGGPEDNYSLVQKGILDYETQVEIRYEEEQKGKIYGHFDFKDDDGVYNFGLIELSNLTVLNEDALKDYSPDYNNPLKFKVLKKDGIEIHKGPANIYEVIGKTIPFGTDITVYNFKGKDSYTAPWFYISYGGVVGYVCELDGVLGSISKYTKSIKTLYETNIYDNASDYNYDETLDKPSGTIPANTILTSFLETDPWSRMLYITDDRYTGYVNEYDISTLSYEIYNRVITVPSGDLILYETAYKNSSEDSNEENKNESTILTTIPAGTVLVVSYEQYDIRGEGWINVTYNGKEGWVYIPDEVLYANLDLNDEDYNNLVSQTGVEVDNTVFTPQKSSEDSNNIIVEEVTNTTADVQKAGMSLAQMAIICIVAGVIIGVTAVVGIIYLNKKNKKNEQ